jgi:hypothetical protein
MTAGLLEAPSLEWADRFQRIQSEYRDMPGLNLTRAQMQRLWALEADICQELIDSLLAAQVLRRTVDGHYVGRRSQTRPGGTGCDSGPIRRDDV